MTRLGFILIIVLFVTPQLKAQPAGCTYPENGAYECKMGDLVMETGYFKNGKKNGEFKRYTFGGKLLLSENYIDDERDGEAKTFYESGQLKFLRKYVKGIRISDESFWEDGKHKYKGTMDSIGRQGPHYNYWKNGELREVIVWKDDKAIGTTNFDEGGNKTSMIIQKAGIGVFMRNYYSNGQTSEEGPLLNGRKEGDWKIFDEAGTLRMEGKYKQDKRTGLWKAYDERGELVQTKTFE